MEGFLLVMSGPTAAGKGTLVRELLNRRDDIVLSTSVTTRYKRANEIDGQDYFFKTNEEFEDLIKNNKLLEYAKVHGNYYGTPRDFVEKNIKEGKIVLLEIDVQGGAQVRENFKNSVSIFVLPPRKKDIEARLRFRGTESEEDIKIRLKTAEEELGQIRYYDHYIINDFIEKAADRLEEIIEEELDNRRK